MSDSPSLPLDLRVNGRHVRVDVDPTTPLLYVLRNDLDCRGVRFGCGAEQCGACKVLLDGQALPSCRMAVAEAVGREIVTVEGLADGGALHAVQRAFLDEQAAQCGFCTAGLIVGSVALLRRHPQPTEEQIRAALDIHLCRCGAHGRILRAVRRAAEAMS